MPPCHGSSAAQPPPCAGAVATTIAVATAEGSSVRAAAPAAPSGAPGPAALVVSVTPLVKAGGA